MNNLNKATTRIRGIDGKVKGSGFLIQGNAVLTCAHVVNLALGRNSRDESFPNGKIHVEFPLSRDTSKLLTNVSKRGWLPEHDIALLELETHSKVPDDALPINVIRANPQELSGHEVMIFGFPEDSSELGEWVQGEILGDLVRGYLQINRKGLGPFVKKGFSGSPVFDKTLKDVIAMVALVHEQDSCAACIPITSLLELLSLLTGDSNTQPSGTNETVTADPWLREYSEHTYHVNTISVSQDSKFVASGGGDRKAVIRELETGKLIANLFHDSWVGSVAFSPDDKFLASSDGAGRIVLWDYRVRERISEQVAHRGACRTIAFSSVAPILASGGHDGKIRLWSIPQLNEIQVLEGHNSEVRRLAFLPNGSKLVSGDREGLVLMWNLEGASVGSSFRQDNMMVRSLATSPDGRMTAITYDTGELIMWDHEHGIVRARVTAHTGHAIGVAFHPDKPLLATGGHDSLIRLIDPLKGRLLRDLEGHQKAVTCVSFSPDGRWLLSGSRDETVKLWGILDSHG